MEQVRSHAGSPLLVDEGSPLRLGLVSPRRSLSNFSLRTSALVLSSEQDELLLTLAREKVALQELLAGLRGSGDTLRGDLGVSQATVTALRTSLSEATQKLEATEGPRDAATMQRLIQMAAVLKTTEKGIAGALKVLTNLFLYFFLPALSCAPLSCSEICSAR
jgi:hypothetical protein